MTYLLRVLFLAFTILSLLAARWAYVRGQPQQVRLAPATAQPSLALGERPQWLPGSAWGSWAVPVVGYGAGVLMPSPTATAL